MNHSESITKIAAALVKVHSQLRPIVKDATNPHFKNKYASLETINEAVRPILTAAGLCVIQGCVQCDSANQLCVTTRVQHESGEWIESYVFMPLEKPTAQGAGSALTYGRRYGLSAALALSTDEDDDGHGASQQRKAPPARQTAPQPAPAAKAALDPSVMPFGKQKGQPLNKFSADVLENALEWAKGKTGYDNEISVLRAELTRRADEAE